MIRAILFDLGGVLFPEKIRLVSERASKLLGFDLNSFAALQKEYSSEVMKGKISFARVLGLLKEKENISFTLEEILFIWEKAYFDVLKPNKSLIVLIKKLQKKYRVGAVSNIYDLTAAHYRKRGYLSYFDPCILSCEVGLEKPRKEIFFLALKKLRLKPEECVFIDDKLSNCEAAKNMGFKVLQFTKNKKLFSDLKSLGVDII